MPPTTVSFFSAYPPTTSRVFLSGHSLIDAIESGDCDPRPTWRSFKPAQIPARAWRRSTIPGSNMAIRWGNRWGGDYDGNPPATPHDPFDVENPFSPLVTARDIGQFDVFMITEAGPFALPLNPDRFNSQRNDSRAMLENFHGLALASGIAPQNVLFWTICPGLNYIKDAEEDADLPDFLALCQRYGRTAEEWCAPLGIRIIPGHRVMAEIWTRIMDGRLPAHADDGRMHYRFRYLFDTAPDDLIHPTYLGSIFVAVGAHAHMFGVMPTDAQIQALLDAEPGHPYTLAHLKDTITATLDYVQGEGVDLQLGTFVPPEPFIDYAAPLAAQGAAILGNGITIGQPVGAGNGFWKPMPAVSVTDRLDMYALIELDYTEAESFTSIALATNQQWNSWDAKFLGLALNDEGANRNLGFLDGDQFTNMVLPPPPWPGNQRLIVELNAGPLGRRLRGLNDPTKWLPAWAARGTRALETNRFGCNVTWAGGNLVTTAGNFTIHKGLVYMGDYPDRLTRLRLIAMFNGGMVP